MSVLERLERQAEEASRQADRLRKIVDLARELGDEGLTELVTLLGAEQPTNGNGNGRNGGHSDEPRGREAVRLIVRERPGVWTLPELREEMVKRGWFTSDSALGAATKRLCDVNGEGQRAGRGRFVFPANYREEDAIESESSAGAMIPGIRT